MKSRSKKEKNRLPLSITLPKGWGDLLPEQVCRIGEVCAVAIDRTETLVVLGLEFADFKSRGHYVTAGGEIFYKFYHRTHGNVVLSAEQIAAIASALDWISVESVTPMIAPALDGYRVPDDKLRDLTLEQFITADTAYSAYLQSRGDHPLRILAASIYARQQYNADLLQQDAVRIGRLGAKLFSVFLWFTGAKILLAEKFSAVFSGESDGSAAVNGAEYLLSTISSLNGGDITRNDAIKRINLYEALNELENKIKSAGNV